MAIGKSKARQTIYKNVLEHPYKKYGTASVLEAD